MIKVNFLPEIKELFAYTPLQYMLHAMEAGNTVAEYYVDQVALPAICFIHEGHNLFIAGDVSNPAVDDALRYLHYSILTPECRNKLHLLKVFYPNNGWRDKILHEMQGVAANIHERCVYTQKAWENRHANNEAEIELISVELTTNAFSQNIDMIRDEVNSTFGSLKKFLSTGFGYALVLNKRVSGFCTSEYQSGKECAIGIEVLEEFQRQGYASKMVSSFLAECRKRGLQPYWECWKNNIPSVKTAEKNGFVKVADYPVIVMNFNSFNNVEKASG